MFSNPTLTPGTSIHELLPTDGQVLEVFGRLGVALDPDGDVLAQAAQYSKDHLIAETSTGEGDPLRFANHADVPQADYLRELGLTAETLPVLDEHDELLIDGAFADAHKYRLGAIAARYENGSLRFSAVTQFAGQRPRTSKDDQTQPQEALALELLTHPLDPIVVDMIQHQLYERNPKHADPWQRPFATEHEIALLGLVDRFGARLQHVKTHMRQDPHQELEGIPRADVQAEEFMLDGDTPVRLLNAPAILREMDGRLLPIETARPTTVSCFLEWLDLVQPGQDSPVILASHAPHTPRTLVDIIIEAHRQSRDDLRIDSYGAPILSHLTYGAVLASLGRLFVRLQTDRQLLLAAK